MHLDELNLEELGLGLPPIEVTTTTSPQNTIASVYDSDVKVANNPDEILDKAYSGVWAKYEDDKPMPKNVQVDAQKVINAYADIKPTIFNAMLSKEIPKVNQIELTSNYYYETSLPYFGVKLSCVCLMFANRKK